MVEHNTVDPKRLDSQLNMLKSAVKQGTNKKQL